MEKPPVSPPPNEEPKRRTAAAVRRHWLTAAFILGFIVDNITLNRVDQLFDNIILASYVILAMGSLLLMYASVAQKIEGPSSYYLRRYCPVVVQYAFGGLLSGMLIFYGRSGSWTESWPFLLIILVAIYGNETLRDRASRLIFNLAILFIGLLSYVVLIVPVILGKMGPLIFVGSGILALIIMFLFLQALHLFIPRFLSLQSKTIIFTIGAIFAGLNFLYFANIIPPIPLSLKEIGIYQSVVRFPDTGQYQVTYEPGPWWKFWRPADAEFHPTADYNASCFVRVFAPTRIATNIFHRWEYYDEVAKDWTQYGPRMSYGISGGRDGGYRGYTQVTVRQDGRWRCIVETERGQVLGSEEFVVNSKEPPGELETRID